jgi:DNA-3-methyladenine glycosylase II
MPSKVVSVEMTSGLMGPERLTISRLHMQVDALTAADSVLARIVAEYGYPPPWQRKPGFATLIHIILEQQVSLASAKNAFDNLQAALNGVTPEGLLTLSDVTLKTIGFSRQKTRYARALAEAVIKAQLKLEHLPLLSDDGVREKLTQIPGIGIWTANVYLMMALGRADIWPQGDLALNISYTRLYSLAKRPSAAELAARARVWQPYRTAAAHLLWHAYLSS